MNKNDWITEAAEMVADLFEVVGEKLKSSTKTKQPLYTKTIRITIDSDIQIQLLKGINARYVAGEYDIIVTKRGNNV